MNLHTKLNVEQARLEILHVQFKPIANNSIMCVITHQCGHIFTGIASCYTLDHFSIKIGRENAFNYAFEDYLAAYSFMQRVNEFKENGTTILIKSALKPNEFLFTELQNRMEARYSGTNWDGYVYLLPYVYFEFLDTLLQLEYVPMNSPLWQDNIDTLKAAYCDDTYKIVWDELENIIPTLNELNI